MNKVISMPKQSHKTKKKTKSVKVLFTGNNNSGKLELFEFLNKGTVTSGCNLNTFNKVKKSASHHGKKIDMCFFSTPGDEKCSQIRILSYPQSNIILMVFSLINKRSLNVLFNTYLKEANEYSPESVVVLVGVDKEKWKDEKYNFLKFG